MNKTDKRTTIIAAALRLFSNTHNVNKVSLEAIAAEAHVSPTTIYNIFKDRDTLVYEVVKALAKANIERNRALVQADLPFPQKIMGIFSGKLELTAKVDQEIIDKMLSQDKKAKTFIDELYEQEIKPLWVQIIADGKKQGYIDPSIDETAFFLYLDIIKAGIKDKMDIFSNFKDNMGLIEQITKMVFYGFIKKDIDLFGKEKK
jgi:AcrR family transcriptional regulator